MTNLKALHEAKSVAREPYAWPGGYPRFLVLADGACLCHVCTKSQFRQIARSAIGCYRDGWMPAASGINWEDPDLICDHCGNLIESAYASLRSAYASLRSQRKVQP